MSSSAVMPDVLQQIELLLANPTANGAESPIKLAKPPVNSPVKTPTKNETHISDTQLEAVNALITTVPENAVASNSKIDVFEGFELDASPKAALKELTEKRLKRHAEKHAEKAVEKSAESTITPQIETPVKATAGKGVSKPASILPAPPETDLSQLTDLPGENQLDDPWNISTEAKEEISHSITQTWTDQAIKCYVTNADCANCSIPRGNYSFVCQMNKVVAVLIDQIGEPDPSRVKKLEPYLDLY